MTEDRSAHHPGIDKLSPDDQEAFAWLGILHEDAVILPATAAVLWSLSEAKAQGRLLRLQEAGLVQPIDDEGYRLDNATHAATKQWLAERMPLPEAHTHLLGGYRAQTRDGLWHTLPDDGYIHQHLTWHMEQAGWDDEIHALLQEETPEGHNGWYETCLRQGQPASYEQDVTRARQLADEREDVGLQCRYALIAASISISRDERLRLLLPRLVETGIWSPEQGLDYACRLPAGWRAQSLAQLAPLLPASLYAEALTAIREIGNVPARAIALADFASHLPASSKMSLWKEILAMAQEIEDMKAKTWEVTLAQVRILAVLSARLTDKQEASLLTRALELARELGLASHSGSPLPALIPHLRERTRRRILEETIADVQKDGPTYGGVGTLVEWAPYLSEAQKSQILEDALIAPRGFEHREMEDQVWDNDTRLVVSSASFLPRPWVPPPRYAQEVASLAAGLPTLRLSKALSVARRVEDAGDRAEALAALAPHLSGKLQANALQEALAAAREVVYHTDRMRVLLAVASVLPEAEQGAVLNEALAAARQIGDWKASSEVKHIEAQQEKAEALARLATHFPEPRRACLFDEALVVVRDIEPAGNRALALAYLAPHLPEQLQVQTALEVWAWVDEQVERGHSEVLNYGPLRCVPEPLFDQVMDILRRIEADETLASVLIELIPRLSEPFRARALANVFWRLESEKDRVRCLSSLLYYLDRPLLQKVLTANWTIGDGALRAQALTKLVPHLPASHRETMVAGAFAALQAVRDPETRAETEKLAETLADLIPHLPEALVEPALGLARTIKDDLWRAWTLIRLAPRLPEASRAQALDEALDEVLKDQNKFRRALKVMEMAALLPGPDRAYLLSEALEMVGGLTSGWAWKLIRENPAIYRPGALEAEWHEQAWATARTIKSDSLRANALADLSIHFAGPRRVQMLEDALAAAREIEPAHGGRADSLLQIAAHLPEPQKAEVLQEALAAALQVEYPIIRCQRLTDLAPQLPEPQKEQALEEGLTAARKIRSTHSATYSAEALARLAPLLPEERQVQVLTEALESLQGWYPAYGERFPQLSISLAGLPAADLYPLWLILLQRMAASTRAEVLSGIHALAPAIVSLGGSEAATEVFSAIQDVSRWWP